MGKKLISVWLVLTILLCSSISIFAEETVTGTFFFRDIRINGTQIWNYELNRPFFLHDGVTYVPMSDGIQKAMGLQCEMDWESRTLKILKTDIVDEPVKDAALASDMNDVQATIVEDVEVITYTPEVKDQVIFAQSHLDELAAIQKARAEAETIEPPVLIAHELDLEELPVMSYANTLYLPLKALTDDPNLGISIYYESYSGLYISTDSLADAKEYWDEEASRYNKGLVNYILKVKPDASVAYAQELVALFQHEAKIHDLDPHLLMAIAHKESTFNSQLGRSGRAQGLMQIMPRTAAGFGVEEWQLYDAHMSVKLASMLLSGHLEAYDNNIVVALSAYNQGSGRVNRGNYTTTYANKILTQVDKIEAFLVNNGFVE
ncbi:MAG: transglycosylase SLT domain-containing protein [Firmicutes bacterium]|nr:transglycosylase SLT domain-containing protein [Bacillota bacterium]